VATPISVLKKWLTIRKAKSIPAETPADVKIGSAKVKRGNLKRIFALGEALRRKSNARQCVVASRPSNSPALPRRLDPVHTDAVSFVCATRSAILFKNLTSFISIRVPHPPGIINKSSFG
jgi:hypothetical protein